VKGAGGRWDRSSLDSRAVGRSVDFFSLKNSSDLSVFSDGLTRSDLL
jgi:hypothetical protein